MKKFAVLVGSLAGGFSIESVTTDAVLAANAVQVHMGQGVLAEALEVCLPSSLNKREKDYKSGAHWVTFDKALDCLTLYGPFPDDEEAEAFGERCRDDGEEWSMLTVKGQSDRKQEIECELASLGFKMQHGLNVLAGDEGHPIFNIRTGEMVDPPNDEVRLLAEEWSRLEDTNVVSDPAFA